jgi:O-antigen/teichoic acid export membrane protein
VAEHPLVPGFVRRAVEVVERSDLAYRMANGAVWTLLGSVLSRALALGAALVAARLLGKDAYGQLGILITTMLMLQVFANVGLGMTATKHVAELRVRDPARAGRILGAAIATSAGLGALLSGLLWALAPWLAGRALGAPGLAQPLRLATTGLAFSAAATVLNATLAGFEAFRQAAWVTVVAGFLGFVGLVTGVYFWGLPGAAVAMAVTAAAECLVAFLAVRGLTARAGIPMTPSGAWAEREVMWFYALPVMAQGILVTPTNWLASAMLVRQPGGYGEMGALSAAGQWYGAVMFFAGAMGSAVLPLLSERVGWGDVAGTRKVLRSAMLLNAVTAGPVVLVGSLVSPWIMAAYGPAFRDYWLTLVTVLVTAGVVAVTNPVWHLLAASGRLWQGFLINLLWASVYLGAAALLVHLGALGVAAARLLGYLAYGGWALWLARSYLHVEPVPAVTPPGPAEPG